MRLVLIVMVVYPYRLQRREGTGAWLSGFGCEDEAMIVVKAKYRCTILQQPSEGSRAIFRWKLGAADAKSRRGLFEFFFAVHIDGAGIGGGRQ